MIESHGRLTARGSMMAVLAVIGSLGPLAMPCAGQQGAAAATWSVGEAQLQDMLANGRQRSGSRTDSTMIRVWLDGVVGHPFSTMLQQLPDLGATTAVSDSVAITVGRFKHFTDSTWAPLAGYLASLPNTYSIDVAWNRVLGASDSVTRRMLARGAAVAGLLSPSQLAQLRPSLKSFLYPACAPWFHERLVSGLSSAPSLAPSQMNDLPVCPAVK